MIILDKKENDEYIEAKVCGNSNSFYKDLKILKKIYNKPFFDKERKVYLIPKDKNKIKKLEEKTKVAFKKDIYFLTDSKAPNIPLTADLIYNKHKNFKDLIKKNKLDELKLDLFDFQKLANLCATYVLEKKGGYLIADTMGLGKTFESLSIAHSLRKKKIVDKIIVSCPKHVKLQWGHEIENLTDLKFKIIDGYNKKKRLACFEEDADIYIINHELLRLKDDFKLIKKINADMIIVDEIHKFKTHNIKQTKKLKKLGEKIPYKLGLTGTPMQNKILDIHSVFEFLIPSLFGSKKDFEEKYMVFDYTQGYPKEAGFKNLFDFKRIINPFMIRRLTKDVNDEMPKVYYKDRMIGITKEQKKIHCRFEKILEENRQIQEKLKAKKNKSKKENEALEKTDGLIMGSLIGQLEVCDDIRLLQKSDSVWIQKIIKGVKIEKKSPKLLELLILVQKILKYDKEFKIVLFTKFSKMLKILKEELMNLDIIDDVALIYGDLSEKERDDNDQKFKKNDNCRILISTDAGAEGINMQNASHLINYDLPWNPAIYKQRNGRIIRIGSKWPRAFITNLLIKEGVDEKIRKSINRKTDTNEIIIENNPEESKRLKKYKDFFK